MRCYLILGAEGSGTRLFTKILIQAGCIGQYDHIQLSDIKDNPSICSLPKNSKKPLVLRRSIPHGVHWFNLNDLIQNIKDQNYIPFLIILFRDWFGTYSSQLRRGLREDLIMKKIKRAYYIIFESVKSELFSLANYEELVTNPKALNKFLKRIDLDELYLKEIDILNLKNENLKYYN